MAVQENGGNLEIERKFLIGTLPQQVEGAPSTEITQGYLVIEPDREVRIRREGDTYTLCRKTGEGLTRGEKEYEISPEVFEILYGEVIGSPIIKQRFTVLDSGVEMTVDKYKGNLDGLVVAEAEFPDEESASKFGIPTWVDSEVTGVKKYSNKNLALHGLDNSEPQITQNSPEKIEISDEMLERFVSKVKSLVDETHDRSVRVGVGGRTSAGKTTAAIGRLLSEFPDMVTVISTDDFAKGSEFLKEQLAKGRKLNYDHPEYYDTQNTRRVVANLSSGEAAIKPVFNFKKGEGEPDGQEKVDPKKIIVVEGLYALSPDLLDLYDTTAFVDISMHGSIVRRLMRDIQRTNMTPDQILRYYVDCVEPMYQEFILPTKEKSEFVIQNEYDPSVEAVRSTARDSQLKYKGEVAESDLLRSGSQYLGEFDQEDQYFFFDKNTIGSQEYLRIRNDGNRCVVTYKGPPVKDDPYNSRARMEFEISPDDEATLKAAVTPDVSIKKRRQMYLLDGVVVMCDSVKSARDGEERDLGNFVELHLPNDVDSSAINKVCAKLKLDPENISNTSYSRM
jgi:predicted adenylyl cyclase CyaB